MVKAQVVTRDVESAELADHAGAVLTARAEHLATPGLGCQDAKPSLGDVGHGAPLLVVEVHHGLVRALVPNDPSNLTLGDLRTIVAAVVARGHDHLLATLAHGAGENGLHLPV